MIVPYDLTNKMKVCKVNSNLHITRYVENAPSKIQTNVKENLLVIVMNGRKKLVCGDYITVISKGEFGFFKKGNYIMNQILTNDIYESLLVFISDEYMREIRNLHKSKVMYDINKKSAPYIQGYIGENLQHEVKQILRLLSDDTEDYEDILNLKIKELVLYLLSGASSEQIMNFIYCCTDETNNLCQYMEQNYEMCQDISSIANALNMSISTFKRKFVHMYGETPGKWINHKKLEKAIKLLNTTDYLMSDICFLCGFESVSTFNVLFKKNFGMTPGQFARKSRRNEAQQLNAVTSMV